MATNDHNQQSLVNTEISDPNFRQKLINEYIQPAFEKDVRILFKWKYRWHRLASFFYTSSMIGFALSIGVSFSVNSFPNITYISYISGCVGIFGLIMEKFSKFSTSQEQNIIKQINKILRVLGLKGMIPDISNNMTTGSEKSKNIHDDIMHHISQRTQELNNQPLIVSSTTTPIKIESP